MHEDTHDAEQESLLDLNEVLEQFGVKTWSNLGSGEDSARSLRLLVEIEGQRYVLSERPEGLIAAESGHHYAFQQYLGDRGIPVALLRQTLRGEPYATLDDTAFELQEWVEGVSFTNADVREPRWIRAAGEMLGRFHQVAPAYSGPQYRWPSEVQAGGLTQGWLHFARAQAEQCEIYAIASALSHLVEVWESALPAAMMAIGTGRDLPEMHIHGDYSALNLRFTSSGICQVLGLEASRWEKRLLEVACGVFYFAGLRWEGGENLTRPLVKRGLDPIRAGQFLQSYALFAPPVPGEAELLVDALTLIAPIITANGPLEDLFYQTGHLAELPLEDVLERLTWATALPSWLQKVRRSFADLWR